MNDAPPCAASRDADAYAHQQGEEDAQDEALDAYVIEHYGPPFDAPEFVEEALKNAPFALTAAIAGTTDHKTIGAQIYVWLQLYAHQCGIRDMKEMRRD